MVSVAPFNVSVAGTVDRAGVAVDAVDTVAELIALLVIGCVRIVIGVYASSVAIANTITMSTIIVCCDNISVD